MRLFTTESANTIARGAQCQIQYIIEKDKCDEGHESGAPLKVNRNIALWNVFYGYGCAIMHAAD